MIMERMVVGPIQTNCYFVGDPGELFIVDPGAEGERILEAVQKHGWKVKAVVLTHAHFDHIGAVEAVLSGTGAKLYMGKEEMEVYHDNIKNVSCDFVEDFKPTEPDVLLSDGDEITSGAFRFRVLHTPGHTKGGICLLCEKILLSGDTLFRGTIGRADLPTGDIRAEVRSVLHTLLNLDDDVEVLPGHGSLTTIGYERRNNEVYEYERYCSEYN